MRETMVATTREGRQCGRRPPPALESLTVDDAQNLP